MGEKLMSSADTKNLVKKIKDTSKQEETLLRSEIEEDFTCSICQDLLLNAHMLECSHSFCKDCLMMWLIKKKVRAVVWYREVLLT
jgi:late competence protein required for DNA uptake (superfamily II DNA/RNA helicase)